MHEIEKIYAAAHAVVAKSVRANEPLPPLLFVTDTQMATHVIDLSGAPSKDAIAAIHQTSAQHPDIVCAILAQEAWMLEIKKKPCSLGLPAGSIANHPDRTEAMVFNILTPALQGVAACRINREISTLEKADILWDDHKSESLFHGRFIRGELPPVH